MAEEHSFDVVSKVDMQEVDNGVNQAKKILVTRYDLKGTRCNINFDKKDNTVEILADDQMKHQAVTDILKERLAARNVSLKALKFQDPEKGLDGSIKQRVQFQVGIPAETAKTLSKSIRDLKVKVQVQNLADHLRVSAKSKDDLQQVIAFLKQQDLDLPLQFANFR